MLDYLWLEITRKCNLECGHCYAGSTPRHPLYGEMSTEHWITALREARELGCRKVQFIGGEPTLHPELSLLIREASQLGFTSIEVFTNATGVTPSLCELFGTYGVKVATSFYTAVAPDHDRITLRPGSYEQTVSGIRQLIGAQIPLRVEFIDISAAKETYTAASALLRDLGVEKISRKRLQNVGRARDQGSSRYAAGDYCGNCGNRRVCVSNDGEIHPCIMSSSIALGHVVRDGLRSALGSTTLRRFRSSIESEDVARTHRDSSQGLCGPDSPSSCGPDHPCGPDGGCGPDDRHCGPDEESPSYGVRVFHPARIPMTANPSLQARRP